MPCIYYLIFLLLCFYSLAYPPYTPTFIPLCLTCSFFLLLFNIPPTIYTDIYYRPFPCISLVLFYYSLTSHHRHRSSAGNTASLHARLARILVQLASPAHIFRSARVSRVCSWYAWIRKNRFATTFFWFYCLPPCKWYDRPSPTLWFNEMHSYRPRLGSHSLLATSPSLSRIFCCLCESFRSLSSTYTFHTQSISYPDQNVWRVQRSTAIFLLYRLPQRNE